MKNKDGKINKKLVGILICTLFFIGGISTAQAFLNNPPNIPSSPHPEDGAIDIGLKTHLSWMGGDSDPGDKATYDLYFGTNDNPELVASNLEKPNYYPGVLLNLTQYYWKVVSKDEQGSSTSGPLWTFTTNDCDCNPPEKPSGPSRVRNRIRYEYSTKIMNQKYNGYYFNFSWGDGNCSDWLGPYNHNERVKAEHEWQEPGVYQVQTRARFQQNNTREWSYTGWSEPIYVEVTSDNPENNPPNTPEINGPTTGKINIYYDFKFITTDPENDDIYYVITWGCSGCEPHTYGPYNSGEEVTINHSWAEQGAFTITAKAKDVYAAEGPEGTFKINIPRSKNLYDFINQVLQHRFQRLIQILQFIL